MEGTENQSSRRIKCNIEGCNMVIEKKELEKHRYIKHGIIGDLHSIHREGDQEYVNY